MRGSNIITINGKPYDAVTGMPFAKSRQPATPPTVSPAQPRVQRLGGDIQPARTMHLKPQKSKTLMRSVLKAPQPTVSAQPAITKRSAHIRHFSPVQPSMHHVRPLVSQSTPLRPVVKHNPAHAGHHIADTTSPTHHAHHAAVPLQRSVEAPAVSQVPAPLRGTHLKNALIDEQLNNEVPMGTRTAKLAEPEERERRSRFSVLRGRHPRLVTMVTGIAAIVVLGGYLTYLNLPSLSIKVAASQAGFAATYPSYQPAGYSFNGPVAFSPGEVKVHFKSNTNGYAYTLVQQSSGWDSQAVLDNFVVKQSPEYATLQERGLTIYLYDNKATWVNGGVLYTIDGNAPLSSEQIQKIASSTL